MKLINGILRPGIIREVLNDGMIKASAPGLFSAEDSLDLLPPIRPFNELISTHSNSYSTPEVGDECWVLNLTDNPLQLYWFRKDNHIENNKQIFEEGGSENVEILCNRDNGMAWATLYFSNGSGWVLRNDDSRLQIFPDGHIELGMNWPHRTIKIDSEAISLGDGKHRACYGDDTSTILLEICGLLEALGKVASMNPYTSTLAPILNKASKIKEAIPGIISPHVKID